jgi:NhaP-type Na+/H+ and K+/H+ antiporter
VLIILGGALPLLWPVLDWRYLAVGLLLLLVVRPVAGWISLLGTRLTLRERAAVSF